MDGEKLILRNENEIHFIKMGNLLAITVEDYLCHFHIENEAVFVCTKALKEIALQLPDYFIKINRNCIVNIKHVKSLCIKKKSVKLSSGLSFRYAIKYLKALEQALGLKQ